MDGVVKTISLRTFNIIFGSNKFYAHSGQAKFAQKLEIIFFGV